MPVILATWETEIRRIEIPGQPKQISSRDSISKITRAIWTVECGSRGRVPALQV
jgi:hypothetical protein